MSKIKNEGKNQEKDVQLVRGAIEQRAASGSFALFIL